MTTPSAIYTGVPATEFMVHDPTESAANGDTLPSATTTTTTPSPTAATKLVVLASVLGFLMSCLLTTGAGLLGHYILLHDEPPRHTVIVYGIVVVLWYTTVSIVLCGVVLAMCKLLQEESWAMEAVEKHSMLWTILEIVMLGYVCMEHAWFLPMWIGMNGAIFICWRLACPRDDAEEQAQLEEYNDAEQPLLLIV